MHGLLTAVAFFAVLVYGADSTQAHRRHAPNCLDRIPPNLIKQLTEETYKLTNLFKRDGARRERVLPTFCTFCSKAKKPIGLWELDSMLELYSELVLPRMGGDLQPRMGGDLQPRMGGDLQPRMGGDLQPRMGGDLQPRMEGDLQPRMGGDLQPRMEGDLQPRMEGDLQPRMGGDLQPRMGGDLQPRMEGDLQPRMGGDLQPRETSRETSSPFMEMFNRVRREVQRCQRENLITPALTNRRKIQKMKRKLVKVMKRKEMGVRKAVGEFPQILHWISELQVLNHTDRE